MKNFASFMLTPLFALFYFTNSNGQSDTTIVQPNIKIEVNKETDDQGNIIRYDSSYSYSYSSSDMKADELDSLFKQWKENTLFSDPNFTYPSFPFDHFHDNDSLWKDPVFRQDFFKRDFFSDDRWDKLMERFSFPDSLRRPKLDYKN